MLFTETFLSIFSTYHQDSFHPADYAGQQVSKEQKIAPNGGSQDNYGKMSVICRYADAISI
jgi:hypothetical protein